MKKAWLQREATQEVRQSENIRKYDDNSIN